MKLILTVLVTVLVKFSSGLILNDAFQYRVYNGYEVSSKEFPFVAWISISNTGGKIVSCSGSLISHYYVLTAAHCFAKQAEKIKVRLGINHIKDSGMDISCDQCWIIPPGYVLPQYPYPKGEKGPSEILDIALIKLPQYVNFTDRVSSIQLPTYGDIQEDLRGQNGKVIGWGEVGFSEDKPKSKLEKVLMATDAYVMDQETCYIIFSASREPYDFKNQFCTLHLKSGTCQGDSGGPFVLRGKQFGVVSGGTNLNPVTGKEVKICAPNYGDNYTKVTRFLKWIEKNSDIKIGWKENTFA